jgi:hypothetical protein
MIYTPMAGATYTESNDYCTVTEEAKDYENACYLANIYNTSTVASFIAGGVLSVRYGIGMDTIEY